MKNKEIRITRRLLKTNPALNRGVHGLLQIGKHMPLIDTGIRRGIKADGEEEKPFL